MCDCVNKIVDKEIKERNLDVCHVQNYGSTMFRTRRFKTDGKPSNTNRYIFADWKYCPFCGTLLTK